MSSPATAGVVALMLQANPNLNADEVKQILKSTARQDDKTGVLPTEGSTLWGFGKVDAFKAVEQALALSSISTNLKNQQVIFFPNPTSDLVYILGAKPNCEIQIFSISGSLVQQEKNTHVIDLQNQKPGIYVLKYMHGNEKITQKVIKL